MGRKKTNVGPCSIDGCEKDALQKGMCRPHYQSWWKHGDPLHVDKFPHFGSPEARFWSKVEKTDSCWMWTAQISVAGYGKFYFEGSPWLAHRFSYQFFVGPIPEGLTIDHVCHSNSDCEEGSLCLHRRCVNPDHLEPVTQEENVARMNGTPGPAEKIHCLRGHPLSGNNLIIRGRGNNGKLRRECRTCSVTRTREWRIKQCA